MELDTAISRFKALLEETFGLWKAIDVRTIAAEFDGRTHNLLCVARLDRRASVDVPRVSNLPLSAPVACFQRICDFNELSSLLQELCEGEIHFGDHRVVFRGRPMNTTADPPPYAWTYVNRATKLPRPPELSTFSAGHVLVARGDAAQSVFGEVPDGLEGINNALRRIAFPWDGVDAIARSAIQTNSRVDYHGNAIFEAFAPLEVRFDSAATALRAGSLRVGVIAAPELCNYVRVGYFGTTADGIVIHGTLVSSRGQEWTSTGELMRLDVECPVPEARRIALFLSVADSTIDTIRVADLAGTTRNPRVLGYIGVDPSLSILRESLAPEHGKDPKAFERAVARVFAFGGLITDSYAFESKLTNGPDALAFAPDNTAALVIECTTGPLGSQSGKMGQLVARTMRLRQRLGEGAPGTVLAVMVSGFRRSELADSDIGDAAQNGVCVLGGDDMLDLLDLVSEHITPEELLGFCLARIPKVNEPSV